LKIVKFLPLFFVFISFNAYAFDFLNKELSEKEIQENVDICMKAKLAPVFYGSKDTYSKEMHNVVGVTCVPVSSLEVEYDPKIIKKYGIDFHELK
jgi:hypothetical protein